MSGMSELLGMSEDELAKLTEKMRRAVGGDAVKMGLAQEKVRRAVESITERDEGALEPMLLSGSFRPSRADVWARFAAGAIALEKGGYPVGAPSAAGLADAMLAEYDRRLLPGELLADDEDDS